MNRKLGPHVNTFIHRILEHQVIFFLVFCACTHRDIKARLGYLLLKENPRGLLIYMSAGGRHEYVMRAPETPSLSFDNPIML